MIYQQAIKTISFSPKSHHLILATGTPRFFLWTPYSASVYELSQDATITTNPTLNSLGVNKVKWNINATSTKLILNDKTHAIIAFPGTDFFTMAQKPELYDSREPFLGNTASKFVNNQFM